MTEKLPRVTAAEVVKALERAGFPYLDRAAATRYSRTAKGNESRFPIMPKRFFIPRS